MTSTDQCRDQLRHRPAATWSRCRRLVSTPDRSPHVRLAWNDLGNRQRRRGDRQRGSEIRLPRRRIGLWQWTQRRCRSA